MKTDNLWPLIDKAVHALGVFERPALEKASKQADLDPAQVRLLLATHRFDPHSVAAWRLRVSSPYTATRRYDDLLHQAAYQGYLKAVHEGEYRLTELGHKTVSNLLEATHKVVAKQAPMPAAGLERLAVLLHGLVDAALAMPEPPNKWCINLSRRLDPGAQAQPMIRIERYLSDLSAYRDDAHMAAWQPTDLNGLDWEVLTLIWRGEAKTIDELAHKLEYRGHTHAEHEGALDDLQQRKLVQVEAGVYQLSAKGLALRQQVEEKTDSYFHAPCAKLAGGELAELRTLLEQFAAGLTKEKTQAAPPAELQGVSG